jgi:hypothetical protein
VRHQHNRLRTVVESVLDGWEGADNPLVVGDYTSLLVKRDVEVDLLVRQEVSTPYIVMRTISTHDGRKDQHMSNQRSVVFVRCHLELCLFVVPCSLKWAIKDAKGNEGPRSRHPPE